MKYLLIVLAIGLFGCDNRRPLTNEGTNNSYYNVELLFTHDKCKMFRFEDKGRYHYFTKCGQTMTEQSTGGKHKSYYEENIGENE